HEYAWLSRELAQSAPGCKHHRLAYLSTFTLEPIRDVLLATGLAHGYDLALYFGGFQQLEQEVMLPDSGLSRHKPDTIVFFWALRDLSPTLWHSSLDLTDDEVGAEIDGLRNRIRGLVLGSRANFPNSRLLLHTFVRSRDGALGIIDFEHPRGHTGLTNELNEGLRRLAEEDEGVHLVDSDRLAHESAPEWFEARHWYSARAPLGPKALTTVASEYVKYVRAFMGDTKKVLVTDLDNTLWGGVLGEDGIDRLALGTEYPGNAFVEFQQELKQLSRRGTVLAINSKNNEGEVREAFSSHGSMVLEWDDFAAKRVNWRDKASNMRELAEELSLGLDSFVFIDDSPHELEIVQQALPEVTVVQVPQDPSELPGLLSRLGFFDSVVYTEADRKRASYYRVRGMESELKRSSTDLEGFYRSLGMRLTVYAVGETETPRVAQLTQRTNQFNMTTRRYTESDIRGFLDDPDYLVRAYRVEDRFGDNGIVGVAIVRKLSEWYLDTLLMSCRIIGRAVEDAILALLAEEAISAGARALVGEFIPTKKNAPACDVYARLGFVPTGTDLECQEGARSELLLDDCPLRVPDWFEVVLPS
ncbi:MAG: HAD-IIIC family phosphatase, partial [Gemmatimonadota bacterium]|nr:HAD-IIIC family phosphatase [Gemmatimonadota bacterium]